MITLEQGEIPRDRWGRPNLPGVGICTRVSTLAKTLDDTGGLMKWGARMTAIGLAQSPDLSAEIAVTDPSQRSRIDALVGKAQDRARAGAGASLGTAIHGASESVDRGESIDHLPESIRKDAGAYRALIEAAGLVPLAAETFVVCDELAVAGSFDRLLQGPNRVVIADLKTSGSADTAKYAGLAWSIQLAAYAHAKPWLPGRGVVAWSEVGLPEPDRERGLVIHVQQGAGVARLYSIDLRVGWRAARMAAEVRALRKTKEVASPVEL